jgi:hypothetical protein
MVIKNFAYMAATLGMLFSNPAICEPIADPATVAEIDAAIRARIDSWYQEQRIDLCHGWGSGQIYDIEDERIHVHEQTATVEYVFVQFERCEEGAAFDKSPRLETWTRKGGVWQIAAMQAPNQTTSSAGSTSNEGASAKGRSPMLTR